MVPVTSFAQTATVQSDECQAIEMQPPAPTARLKSAVVGYLIINPRDNVIFPLEKHQGTI